MKIQIGKKDLDDAIEKELISIQQANNLWDYLIEKNKSKITFTGINVTYYFGALVVISAMTWFATEAFAKYHSFGLYTVGVLYFTGLFITGKKFYFDKRLEVPGGLLLTCAVFMIPLIVFSIQKYFGLWGDEIPGTYKDFYVWVKKGWFVMELSTIIVAILFLSKFKFTFLTFPLSFSLWFLSMDITPIIFIGSELTWDHRKQVSLVFGLIMLVVTYVIDRNTKKDYAFWLYLFGMLCFWGGLSLMDSNSELSKFIYFVINVVIIVISVVFKRKLFIVFGALGVYGYLYHLSDIVFKDSLLFPFVLSLFGIGIIWIGILYNKNQDKIDEYVDALLPKSFIKLLPKSRE